MQPINLFDLATQQARWLSVRQSSVAGNIANINTPDYRATEVEPFEKVLNNTQVAMRATNAAHFGIAPGENKPALRPADPKASVSRSMRTPPSAGPSMAARYMRVPRNIAGSCEEVK